MHCLINGASCTRWSNIQDLIVHWCTRYLLSTLILPLSSTSRLLPLSHLPQLRDIICHYQSPVTLSQSMTTAVNKLISVGATNLSRTSIRLPPRAAPSRWLQCPLLCITRLWRWPSFLRQPRLQHHGNSVGSLFFFFMSLNSIATSFFLFGPIIAFIYCGACHNWRLVKLWEAKERECGRSAGQSVIRMGIDIEVTIINGCVKGR